ncbi:MAG: NrsF family protein [Bradymonadia bacterium]
MLPEHHSDKQELLPPQALRDMVAQDMAALARKRRNLGAVSSIVALAIVAGLAQGFGLSPTIPPRTWITSAVLLVVGLTLFGLAFGLVLPAGRRLKPLLLFAALGGVIILLTLSDFQSHVGLGDQFWAMGFSCLKGGALTSTAILATTLVAGRKVLRRHAPTGLLLGLGAGFLGLVPVSTHCIAESAGHVMVWHTLIPIVACGLAGALWGFLRPEPEID